MNGKVKSILLYRPLSIRSRISLNSIDQIFPYQAPVTAQAGLCLILFVEIKFYLTMQIMKIVTTKHLLRSKS